MEEENTKNDENNMNEENIQNEENIKNEENVEKEEKNQTEESNVNEEKNKTEEITITETNTPPAEFKPWGMEINQFNMFMHLSQFAGMIVPFGGLVLPIVMWTTNKDQNESIDEHGKNILNWIISSFIYIIVSVMLMFIVVGFVTLFAVIICSIIFTIQGAIKANNGEVYKYPMCITFVR